jgi:maleylpyruvate isomerase
MTAFDADPVLADVTAQTDAFLETVRGLADADIGGPSLCPGWTRGHVLSHVARNADAMALVLQALQHRSQAALYPDRESRDAAIEAGAVRSAAELEADVETSAERFLAACAACAPASLDGRVTFMSGRQVVARDLPWMRWREVVLHHADLDAGFDLRSAGPLVLRALDDTERAFGASPDAPGLRLVATDVDRTWTVGDGASVVTGPAADLLAWACGRSSGAGLSVAGGRALPALPPWA